MKILLAADGSRFTKHMLAYIAAHDEWWRSQQHRFTVLTVVPALPARAAGALAKPVVHEHYAEEAEETLKPIRKFFAKQGIEADFVHHVGDPADQISQMARKGKFDLLLMGSHGRGALARLVMGSVVARVLATSDVPVLIVR